MSFVHSGRRWYVTVPRVHMKGINVIVMSMRRSKEVCPEHLNRGQPQANEISSKKCLDNQDKEFENSRIESKPRESKDDFRSRTKALVDSMMEKISQVLDSHLEQLNHVSTSANKGKFHSSPSLIEEPHMNEL